MLFYQNNLFAPSLLLLLTVCNAPLVVACDVRDISLGRDPGRIDESVEESAAVDRDADTDNTAVDAGATGGSDGQKDDAEGGRDTRRDNEFRDAETGDGAYQWGSGIDSATMEFEACGSTFCHPGFVCCESCGICTPPGAYCPQDCLEWIQPQRIFCETFECGDPPAGAAMSCPIGTIGGAFCLKTGEGTCAWQFVQCFEPTNAPCGESIGYTCGSYEYCDAPDCGKGTEIGFCQFRPTGCERYYEPVCGCDGHEYDNTCLAHMAGTNVAYEGSCRQSNDS